MKLRFASLSLLALGLMLAAATAMAQVVYSNGPTNGNTDAWTVNFGFVVSDSFYVPSGGSNITGATFAMWLIPGDVLSSAELSITSSENGGTSYFDQTVGFSQSGCVGNQFGYNVCNETTSFNGPTLNSGPYWLNVQNAEVPSGDPVYWDENSGGTHAEPAGASENSIGTIPGESFTVLGSNTTSTIPEPNDPALLLSGFVGLAAVLWRKRF